MATPAFYTLSLHDALPISTRELADRPDDAVDRLLDSAALSDCLNDRELALAHATRGLIALREGNPDRKSTRLNSSHVEISYAVFCLKKKNKNNLNSYARFL